MIDYTKLELFSGNSSNKVLLEGSGTFTVPNLPGAGDTFGVGSVVHPFGSDNLLFQVSITTVSSGAAIDPVVLPWASSDNRTIAYAQINASSLDIYVIHVDSSGFGFPTALISYDYRILVP